MQHRMRDDGRDLWDWLSKGAHIYVCGDALRMAKDVERALIDVVAEHGKRSLEDAARYVAELEEERPLSGGCLLKDRCRGHDTHPFRNTPGSNGAAGAAAGVPGARRQARGARRRQRRGGLEGGAAVGCRRARRCLRRGRCPTRCWQVAGDPPRGDIAVIRRGWTAEDLAGAAVAIGAFEDDDGRCGFRHRGARPRRSGQCDRQAGVLRFCLRRHRQSFSLGDRHFDRRRRAGVRAGDPRQARSAAAEGLCRLGLRRRALALGGESIRPVVFGPAQVLAAVHRACGHKSRQRADAKRFRPLCRRGEGPGQPRSRTVRSPWSAPVPAIRNC